MNYPGNIHVTIFLPLGLPTHCFSKYIHSIIFDTENYYSFGAKKKKNYPIPDKNSSNPYPWGGTSPTLLFEGVAPTLPPHLVSGLRATFNHLKLVRVLLLS